MAKQPTIKVSYRTHRGRHVNRWMPADEAAELVPRLYQARIRCRAHFGNGVVFGEVLEFYNEGLIWWCWAPPFDYSERAGLWKPGPTAIQEEVRHAC